MSPRSVWTNATCRVCEVTIKAGDCIVSLPIAQAASDPAGELVVQGTLLPPIVLHVGCLDRLCATLRSES